MPSLAIQRLIKNRPQKNTLVLSEFKLVEQDLETLVTQLNTAPEISTLILKWCELDNTTAPLLAGLVHIKELDVSYNNIEDPNVFQAFAKPDRILDISNNNLPNTA